MQDFSLGQPYWQVPNGGVLWGGGVSFPDIFFLILGSQNAYFGAFSGPPESDSVVLT